MFNLKKIVPTTIIASSLLLSSANFSFANASSLPEIYKFVPEDSVVAFNIKTSKEAWKILDKNKSLSKIDFFKEISKGGKEKGDSWIDALLSEKNRKNMGDNLVFSISGINDTKKANINIKVNKKNKMDFSPNMLLLEELKSVIALEETKASLKTFYKDPKKYKLTESKFKEAKILSFKKLKPSKTDEFVDNHFAFLNNYIVVSNDKASLENSLKAFYGENNSLSNSNEFSKEYDKVGENYQAQFYLNTTKIGQLMEADKSSDKMMESLTKNFKNNKSMLFNLQLNPQDVTIKYYSLLSEEGKQAQKVHKPSDFNKYLNYIPKNAILFVGSSDLKDGGEALRKAMSQLEEQTAARLEKDKTTKINEKMNIEQQFKDFSGMNLYDIFDNIKEEFVLSVFNTEANPLIPGVAVFMNPKDKDLMVKTFEDFKVDLGKFEGEKGNRSKKAEGIKKVQIMSFSSKKTYKDVEFNTTNEIDELVQMGIQPAYCFINDTLVFGSNEEVLKAIVDRSKNPSPSFSLAGETSYAKATAITGASSSGTMFINLKSLVGLLGAVLGKKGGDMVNNLKKVEAIASSSTTEEDGSIGSMAIIADIEHLDFQKIMKEMAEGTSKKPTTKKRKP